jgi:hypothetical protein
LIITEHLVTSTQFAIIKVMLPMEQIYHLVQANIQ